MQKRKPRRKFTEVVITESAEIHSIIPNEDGSLSILDGDGLEVSHVQQHSVGYLRDSGKPKFLRTIPKADGDKVGENPWKKYDIIGFIDTNSDESNGKRLFVFYRQSFLAA